MSSKGMDRLAAEKEDTVTKIKIKSDIFTPTKPFGVFADKGNITGAIGGYPGIIFNDADGQLDSKGKVIDGNITLEVLVSPFRPQKTTKAIIEQYQIFCQKLAGRLDLRPHVISYSTIEEKDLSEVYGLEVLTENLNALTKTLNKKLEEARKEYKKNEKDYGKTHTITEVAYIRVCQVEDQLADKIQKLIRPTKIVRSNKKILPANYDSKDMNPEDIARADYRIFSRDGEIHITNKDPEMGIIVPPAPKHWNYSVKNIGKRDSRIPITRYMIAESTKQDGDQVIIHHKY